MAHRQESKQEDTTKASFRRWLTSSMKKLKVSNSMKKRNFLSKSHNVSNVSETSFEEVFSDSVDVQGGTSSKGKRMRDGWMGGRLRQQMSLNIPQQNNKNLSLDLVPSTMNHPPLATQEDLPEEERTSSDDTTYGIKQSFKLSEQSKELSSQLHRLGCGIKNVEDETIYNHDTTENDNTKEPENNNNNEAKDNNNNINNPNNNNNNNNNDNNNDNYNDNNTVNDTDNNNDNNDDGDNDDEKMDVSMEVKNGELKEDEDVVSKNIRKRDYVLRELIDTEKDYVKDLKVIVEDYKMKIEAEDENVFNGKNKIIFGNIHQIYDFHQQIFYQELQRCLDDVNKLGPLFVRYERRLHMYVKYCENKPKSEFLVAEYIDFFEDMRLKLGHRLQMPDLLIKPVQRITKYQLLLKDIVAYSSKAGENTEELEKALEVMKVIPKAANDMMSVGRLQGFEGKITAQGMLLLHDTLMVMDDNHHQHNHHPHTSEKGFKARKVFLFEQMIIFSEEHKRNNLSNSAYLFKHSIMINKMALEEGSDGTFTIISKHPTNPLRLVCEHEKPEVTEQWVSQVKALLQLQGDLLKALVSPIEYQKVQDKKLFQASSKEQSDSEHNSPMKQQDLEHKTLSQRQLNTNSSLRKTNSQPKSSNKLSSGNKMRTNSNPALKSTKLKDTKEANISFIESFFDKKHKINNANHAVNKLHENQNIIKNSSSDDRCKSESPAHVKRSFLEGIKHTFSNFKSHSHDDLKSKSKSSTAVLSKTKSSTTEHSTKVTSLDCPDSFPSDIINDNKNDSKRVKSFLKQENEKMSKNNSKKLTKGRSGETSKQ